MKQFEIQTDKPVLCHANVYIRTNYQWGIGWKNPADKDNFMKDIKENLPYGGFKPAGKDGLSFKLVNEQDPRQFIRCSPMELEYMGTKEGLAQLQKKVREGNFSSFEYIGTAMVKDVYDMSKQEVAAVFDKNKKVIRENIREQLAARPGMEKTDVVDNVFEAVRVLNTHDASYGVLWDAGETGYGKVSSVFNKMVKDKEITLDSEGKAQLAEKKLSLRPAVKTRVNTNDNEMGLFA